MERDLTTLRYQAASTGTGTLAVTIEELNAVQRALDAEREKVKAEQEQWEIQAREGGRLKDQLTQLQAQLAGLKRNAGLDCGDQSCLYAVEHTGMRTNGGCRCDPKRMKDDLVRSRKACDALQAQLRQVEEALQQQAEEAVIVFAKYTTLRQLVEALPVVDGRMDVECGACYYIRSFIAGQYGVVCGLITEQSTAMAIKALLEYRATQAAQDAGAKLPAWVNEAMRLAPTQTNPPHPTEERS